MMDDPTSVLTAPRPENEAVASGFVSPTALLDLFSPSAWVFDSVKAMTGVDVLGDLVAPLSGHWTMVSAYGDALVKLSLCLREVSTNVQETAVSLDALWDGNAADAAYMYFAQTAAVVSSHGQLLGRASDEYLRLARALWHLMEAMKGLVQALLDRAVRAAIYALAGTLTSQTGVGALVGFGLAAYEIAAILQLTTRITMVVTVAESTIFGFGALMSVMSKELEDIRPLPAIEGPLRLVAVG